MEESNSSMNDYEGGDKDYPSDSEYGDDDLDSNLDMELMKWSNYLDVKLNIPVQKLTRF